jgi:hypothetical protein
LNLQADIGIDIGMKAISLHVPDQTYDRFRELAARRGRPAAELIREAMESWLAVQQGEHSILDIQPRTCGRQLAEPDREATWDEMFGSGE